MNDKGVAVYQHGSWSPTPAEAVGDAAAGTTDGQFAINTELCIYKLQARLTHSAEHLSVSLPNCWGTAQIIWPTVITGSLPWCLFNETFFLWVKLAVLVWRSIDWAFINQKCTVQTCRRGTSILPDTVFCRHELNHGNEEGNLAEQQDELKTSDPKEFLHSRTHFKRGKKKQFWFS